MVNVVKTPLIYIPSASLTPVSVGGDHRVRLAEIGDLKKLRETTSDLLKVLLSDSYTPKITVTQFPEGVIAHVVQVVRYYSSVYLTGAGFVRHTHNQITGIVERVSFSASTVEKSVNRSPTKDYQDDATTCVFEYKDEDGIEKIARFHLHVAILLPNRRATTWSITKAEALDDVEGLSSFLKSYPCRLLDPATDP